MKYSPPQRFWSELRRGAWFGAVVAGSIVGLLGIVCLLLVQFVPALTEIASRDASSTGRLALGFAGGVLLSAVYGAMVGAIIFGGRAAILARRQRIANQRTGVR